MKITIPNYSNANFASKFRHWLIRLVAGKHAVVMNVQIDIVPRAEHPGCVGAIKDVNGGLVSAVVFPNYGKTIIRLSGTQNHDQ